MEQPDLGPLRRICVDDVPYMPFKASGDWLTEGAFIKRLAPADSGLHFIVFRFPPNFRGPAHWHDFDTIYLIKSGEFIIDGEGSYFPGDVRWVKGGTAYGAETGGAEGCEVYVISMGPIALRNPEVEPPPLGYAYEAARSGPPAA